MHEFRWMAPIRVGFTSSPGILDREPARYRTFWDRVADRASDRPWSFPRASSTDDLARIGWSKAAADVLHRPLEVVTGTLTAADVPAFPDLEVAELGWTLYDHGVLLVEGRLEVAATATAEHWDDAEHWEQAVQDAGRDLTRLCAELEYAALESILAAVPDHADLLMLEQVPVGEPLWVTRSLALDPADPSSHDLARRWVSEIDSFHREAIEEVISGERPLLARWLNHVYRPDRGAEVELSWNALKKAQFCWSAMHWIDQTLREILAWSMADHKDISVGSLRTALQAAMNQAQEQLMLMTDIRQQVSRQTHAEMQRFLGGWDYTELLETPVREKVDICQQRLEVLAEERAARSSIFTDIILMSIGVTSVLATAIALVQFGRDAGQDPSQSVFDLGSGSITSWVSSQSMDAILIVSLLLSIVLVVVFIWKRRQSIS
ncbi:hypothetical protein C1N80_00815 [Brachybacterium sp. SGAir0954]|uniref:hypothetical protein n=1 Tax=Brachybacterium sp. SGAir0954 TaxID=2571029 RepID=UPI0010CD4F59|nr:hypothetical protein [Brachybacterium sp. SGAir0954]QCR52264.1 hypothetical protein C1N80_00815 [Brachybacterium sp. SGAir0954]